MGTFESTMMAVAGAAAGSAVEGPIGGVIGAQVGLEGAAGVSQMKALSLEQQEKNLQLSQQRVNVYDNTIKSVAHQQAMDTIRGVDLSSPSARATKIETMNIGSEALQNIDTEQDLIKYSTDIEKQNVSMSTFAKMFGTIGTESESFAKLLK